METHLDINYLEILNRIRQLPCSQIERLKRDLTNLSELKPTKKDSKDLQALLLEGPVMIEAQYQDFRTNRKHFNQWRTQ